MSWKVSSFLFASHFSRRYRSASSVDMKMVCVRRDLASFLTVLRRVMLHRIQHMAGHEQCREVSGDDFKRRSVAYRCNVLWEKGHATLWTRIGMRIKRFSLLSSNAWAPKRGRRTVITGCTVGIQGKGMNVLRRKQDNRRKREKSA